MQSAYVTQLRRAFSRHELQVHYQPKYDLATCAPCGVEALMRWRTASGSWISPSVFIPMLEESGLIQRAGTWLFERAAEDCDYWRACGQEISRVAINVSPLQLGCQNFRSWLLSICGAWSSSGTGLDIELTESSLLPESDDLMFSLHELVASKVRIALDDFGIGYSSLSLLTRLPVSCLKIDRSFVTQMHSSRKAAVVVETIIRLGQEMGLETVAEGIETAAQLHRLQELGCDIGQGHFFCAALERNALLGSLRTECAARARAHHGTNKLQSGGIQPLHTGRVM